MLQSGPNFRVCPALFDFNSKNPITELAHRIASNRNLDLDQEGSYHAQLPGVFNWD